MERFIKVAADSISTLRKMDVYRVLVESNREEFQLSIADYIRAKRPDLAEEVNVVLKDELAQETEKATAPISKPAPQVNEQEMPAPAQSLFGLSGLQVQAMQGGKLAGAENYPGFALTQEQVVARANAVQAAKEQEAQAVAVAIGTDRRLEALHDAGLPASQLLQAAKELNEGDDSLLKDLARISNIDLAPQFSQGGDSQIAAPKKICDRDAIAKRYAQVLAIGRTGVSEEPGEFHYRFADAIVKNQPYGLQFLSNGLNDAGKAVFTEVTGIQLPKQQGATWSLIREWGGLSELEDNKNEAKRKLGVECQAIQSKVGEKAVSWANEKVESGFNTIKKVGSENWLVNEAGQGFNLSKRGSQLSLLAPYLKAKIAYETATQQFMLSTVGAALQPEAVAEDKA